MIWGIMALTVLLGMFVIDRACSISRSSSMMDSFGDLYTLAFKNLTSLFLPIVLGMFATALFFDEQKNDTLKLLLIIPISKSIGLSLLKNCLNFPLYFFDHIGFLHNRRLYCWGFS